MDMYAYDFENCDNIIICIECPNVNPYRNATFLQLSYDTIVQNTQSIPYSDHKYLSFSEWGFGELCGEKDLMTICKITFNRITEYCDHYCINKCKNICTKCSTKCEKCGNYYCKECWSKREDIEYPCGSHRHCKNK